MPYFLSAIYLSAFKVTMTCIWILGIRRGYWEKTECEKQWNQNHNDKKIF